MSLEFPVESVWGTVILSYIHEKKHEEQILCKIFEILSFSLFSFLKLKI